MANADGEAVREELDLDIDLRLLGIWPEVSGCSFYEPLAWAYIRAAYGLGYLDALREQRRGQLLQRSRLSRSEP